MRGTRIATAAAAGVMLMGGLTACGGGSGSGSGDGGDGGGMSPTQAALAALKKASESTEAENSARVEGHQTQDTAQGPVTSDTEGSVDWSGGGTTGEMRVTQKGGLTEGTPMAGKATPTRYTEDAMYVNMGDEFASSAGKGKHWVKYDYDALAEQAGASGAFLKDQMQNNNPARSVDLLLASGKVRKTGSETVGGEQTTRYSGTVKIADMARMQSKELSEKELDQLADQMEQQGFKTQKIDLWINGEDLLVKKREQATGKDGSLESTVTYSDYGTEVSVEEPSGSDTVDFQDLMGSSGLG